MYTCVSTYNTHMSVDIIEIAGCTFNTLLFKNLTDDKVQTCTGKFIFLLNITVCF